MPLWQQGEVSHLQGARHHHLDLHDWAWGLGNPLPVVEGFFGGFLFLSLRVISHVLHVEAEVQPPLLHAPRELEIVVLPAHRPHLRQYLHRSIACKHLE